MVYLLAALLAAVAVTSKVAARKANISALMIFECMLCHVVDVVLYCAGGWLGTVLFTLFFSSLSFTDLLYEIGIDVSFSASVCPSADTRKRAIFFIRF